MFEEYKRAEVSPGRDRELDFLAWQILFQIPKDMGEALVIYDKCMAVFTHWVERGAIGHESAVVRPLRLIEGGRPCPEPAAAPCAADPAPSALDALGL